MGKLIDISGHRFGRLLAVGFVEMRNGNSYWLCRCDCGSEVVVSSCHLRSEHTSSCGCLHRQMTADAKRSHGHTVGAVSPTYQSWTSMIKRCLNHKATNFARYGGRGISVCESWRSFENFLADMGTRPSLLHELDRIDNGGDYAPGNCRWALPATQSRNRRSNRVVDTPLGPMLLVEAVERSGLAFSTIFNRLRVGWPACRLFDPPRGRRPVHAVTGAEFPDS